MIQFSLPLVCTNLLQVLFSMVDVAVVGKYAGTTALGAVGSTPNLLFLFVGLLTGLGSGVNAIMAYYVGAKDKKSVDETIYTAFLFCIFSGFALCVLGIAFAKTMLSAMNTKPDLLPGAVLYFRIYMVSMPAAAIYNFGNGVFSAIGETKKPLYFLALSGVVNIALDLLFVICFKMNVAGVAYATVIAQYISAVLMMIFLIRGNGQVHFSLRALQIERTKLARIVSIGLPAGMQNAIFAFANVFVQIGVNSFDSLMVAGTSASANIDPLIYNVMAAFYVACSTFIAQNYGAGNKIRVLNCFFVATAISFFNGLVLGTLLFFFGSPVLGFFTSDGRVIECALRRVKILAFSYCVSAFMDSAISACRGLGKTLVPSVFVLLGSCVFRIAWIYTIFAHFGTIESLFLLYVFSWGITALFESAYFYRIYKAAF